MGGADGRELGNGFTELTDPDELVVLGISRGDVPLDRAVAGEIDHARELGFPESHAVVHALVPLPAQSEIAKAAPPICWRRDGRKPSSTNFAALRSAVSNPSVNRS